MMLKKNKGKKRKELRRMEIIAELAMDKTNKKIEKLGEETNQTLKILNEMQSCFDAIRNVPSEEKLQLEELKKIRLDWQQQAEKIEKDYNQAVKKGRNVGIGGVGAGATVALTGPTAAMGIATTFGVASTGTAISSLSGAAATNAALAWLGGGALTAGGGGVAAGTMIVTLAGPIGWALAGAVALGSGAFVLKSHTEEKEIEKIYTLISERDEKSYNLATLELIKRIERVQEETTSLEEAMKKVQSFGEDYNLLTEEEKYELGSYVNLMNSVTQLLINPILGIQPKFSEEDYYSYMDSVTDVEENREISSQKNSIIALANLLYKIDLTEKDKKLIYQKLKINKEFLHNIHKEKKHFKLEIMDLVEDALKYKYKVELEKQI